VHDDGFLIDDVARVTDFSCSQVEGECPSLVKVQRP